MDPFADRSAWLPRLAELGVPRYDLPEEFVEEQQALKHRLGTWGR